MQHSPSQFNSTCRSEQAPGKETKIQDYLRYVQYLLRTIIPGMSVPDKSKFIYFLRLIKMETRAGWLPMAQVKAIIKKTKYIPDFMEKLYVSLLMINEEAPISMVYYVDIFIKVFEPPRSNTLSKPDHSTIMRAWGELIPMFIFSSAYKMDETNLHQWLKEIQSINDDYKYDSALAVIVDYDHTLSFKLRMLQLIFSARSKRDLEDMMYVVHALMAHPQISPQHSVNTVARLFSYCQSKFLKYLLKKLNPEWYLVIIKPPHSWAVTLTKFASLYHINPQIFERFECPSNRLVDISANPFVDLFLLITKDYIPPYLSLKYLDNQLNQSELKLFHWLALGNNLAKYPELPVQLTSFQAHLFLRPQLYTDENLLKYYLRRDTRMNRTYQNNFLSSVISTNLTLIAALAWVKVLDNLMRRLNCSSTSELGLNQQIQAIENLKQIFLLVSQYFDLKKWLDIMPVIVYANLDCRFTKLLEVLNYVEGNIIRINVTVDFKRKKWPSLLAEAKEWNGLTLMKKTECVYPVCNIPRMELIHDGVLYVVEQITNQLQLHEEGKCMRHCVAGYHRELVRGKFFVFRIMEKRNHIMQPCLTVLLTVFANRITLHQVKGKLNRNPSTAEKEMLKLWYVQASTQINTQAAVA